MKAVAAVLGLGMTGCMSSYHHLFEHGTERVGVTEGILVRETLLEASPRPGTEVLELSLSDFSARVLALRQEDRRWLAREARETHYEEVCEGDASRWCGVLLAQCPWIAFLQWIGAAVVAVDVAALAKHRSPRRERHVERELLAGPPRPLDETATVLVEGVEVALVLEQGGRTIPLAVGRTDGFGESTFPLWGLVSGPLRDGAPLLVAESDVGGRRARAELPAAPSEALFGALQGADMSEAEPDGPVSPRAELRGTYDPARETLRLELELSNDGPGAMSAAAARLESDEPALDGWTLRLGRVEPGVRLRRAFALPLPAARARAGVAVRAVFRESNGSVPASPSLALRPE